MTYREAIYIVLDEIKAHSDDATFTEDHVLFLLDKYRAFFLKRTYDGQLTDMSDSNYQTLCLDLEEVPAIAGLPCEGGVYLRSTKKVPSLIGIGVTKLFPVDYFNNIMLTYVTKDRMAFVGNNKSLKNFIYATIGPDNYVYLKSSNPQFLYLQKIRMSGIFEDSAKATELQCDKESCDIFDVEFPLEYALVPEVTAAIVKELLGAELVRSDNDNDAQDNLADENAGVKQ